MKVIATVRSDFPDKFGIPRQSGLVPTLRSMIVFEPEYRVADALRGLDGFNYLWILWGFHLTDWPDWSPTVRPPRLGGNARVGVFATRSPNRPNPIGLSSVRLEAIEERPGLGTVLIVSGADMADGTPVYDIKPYVPYTDIHADAKAGFTDDAGKWKLRVEVPEELETLVPEDRREALRQVLAQDPRPGYQRNPDREYGFGFAGLEIRFRVTDDLLTVIGIERERK